MRSIPVGAKRAACEGAWVSSVNNLNLNLPPPRKREVELGFGAEIQSERNGAGLDLDLRGFLGLMRRQARLILATVFGICTITTLALFQITPIFAATALIIVDPRQQSILDPGGQMAVAPSDLGSVESEVEILRSPSVFLTVVRELELFKDPEFGPSPGWFEKLASIVGLEPLTPTSDDVLKSTLEALQNTTSISRVGITYLIGVTVRSTDPEKAAKIANAIARGYVAEQVAAKVEMVVGIQQALLSRLNEGSATLRMAEAKLDEFIAKNVDIIADDASRRDLVDLRNQIATRVAENARLSSLLASSQSDLADRDWQDLVTQVNAESVRALYDKRLEIAEAIDKAGQDSDRAFDLRTSLAQLDTEIEAEARNAVDRVRETLDASQKTEGGLREQLRTRILNSQLPKEMLVKLYEIQQEATVSRTVYQDLLGRSKAFEAQKDVQVPDSRIVSQALPPSRPAFPKKALTLGIAGTVSLMLGLGFAFVRERYVGGFVGESQAEHVLGVPVIASLPRLSHSGAALGGSTVGGAATEIVDHPLSPYSEAVRRARLALEFGVHRAEGLPLPQTIMVTSALPAEGKSQTAISIAKSLALAGRKTLLIDCDLRRPSVHKALSVDLKSGLSDYLSGNGVVKSLSEILIKDSGTDLAVVLGLRGARSATDFLFESKRFSALLESAREIFDYVVIDTSPILPVVDPRILVRHVDAVLMVVKWASTSQRDVFAAVRDLERVNSRGVPIFAILNQADVGVAGYGSGYKYDVAYVDNEG